MHALKPLFFVASCLLTLANSEVALVIGGFGASDSVQVITKDSTCLGTVYVLGQQALNTSYLTDSYISFTLKLESG